MEKVVLRAWWIALIFSWSPPVLATVTVAMVVTSPRSSDPELPRLRFARSDGERMAEALIRVGGVSPEGLVIVDGGGRDHFRRAAKQVSAWLAKQKAERSKLILYFTGHADADGLHFIDGSITRPQLHQILASVNTDSKIVILDSCYAGALTEKGVALAMDFQVPTPMLDEPEGVVFLSAASGSEQAFEVEELRGSFFTHHLLQGLYGLADDDEDGLVTVDELYRYSYRRMRTGSLSLPRSYRQSPEIHTKLKGKGALVVSQWQRQRSRVLLNFPDQGSVTFSTKRGVRFFVYPKRSPQPQIVEIAPGQYKVVVDGADQIKQADLLVSADQENVLGAHQLEPVGRHDGFRILKGHRESSQLSVATGSYVSTVTDLGIGAWLRYQGISFDWNLESLRTFTQIGVHRHSLRSYQTSTKVTSQSLMIGATLEHTESFMGRPLSWNLGIGAGLFHLSAVALALSPIMPKFTALLEVSLPTSWRPTIGLQREWLFAKSRLDDTTDSLSATSLYIAVYL